MSTVLWILLEGSEAQRTKLTSDLGDLSDLASHLVSTKPKLQQKQIDDSDLIFFYSNTLGQNLRRGTMLKEVEKNTSDENPLIVRYPLSSNTILANLRFLNATEEIRLPHTTGTWHMLLAKTKAKFDRLREDNEFYFVDQETKKKTIDEEFTFNDVLKKIKPNSEDEIIINLMVRIKGKKPYGEWKIKDVLREILHKQYVSSFHQLPKLHLELSDKDKLNDEEFTKFTDNLKRISSAFHNMVSSNEATARNFINPFLVDAVAKVRLEHPSVILAVEQDFDGSRGYGLLDYVIYCHDLAVVVTEAKMTEMQKGLVQNIVQLHTASEKKRKYDEYKETKTTTPTAIFGIVSTGREWQFLRWSGTPEKPILEISESYHTSFEGDMPETQRIVSTIIHILQLQASAWLTPQVEAEERLAQRIRHE